MPSKKVAILLALVGSCAIFGLGAFVVPRLLPSPPEEEPQIPTQTVVTIPALPQELVENLANLGTVRDSLQIPLQTFLSLGLNYLEEQSVFDLPLQGATGFASIPLNVRDTPNGTLLATVPQGVGFVILAEEGDSWLVDYQGTQGYVYPNYCFLNLPDVLPSAVYLNTNATSSVFTSSYVDLPGVTGTQLYQASHYNPRLDKTEFTMPVLYQTAIKIAKVQRMALEQGETLVINELYRPATVQKQVVTAMTSLSNANATVREGITTPPWSLTWFISTGVSNHQKGYAIDTSLAKVIATEEKTTGDYCYQVVTEYQEYPMPTPIHELSYHSASMTRDVIQVPVPPSEAELQPEPQLDFLPEETPTPFPEETTPEETTPEETAPEEAPTPEETTPEETLPPVPEDTTPEETAPPVPEDTTPEETAPVSLLARTQPGETSTPETTTSYSSWRTADTMTPAANRLQDYFVAVGMEPIASEWWHFNDFSSGGSPDNVGDYLIQEIHSLPPKAP